MTDEFPWIRLAFVLCAMIGATLAICVMKMAKNKDDPPWLRDARRIAFFAASSFLLFSAAYILNAELSLRVVVFVAVLLIAANDTLLALNVISLHLRSPPQDGDRVFEREIHPSQFGHYLAMALADIERLDEGQKLTHEFLEAIHNNQGLKPDSIVVQMQARRKQP